MIEFSKKVRENINKNLPTLGEKFDSRNRGHQIFVIAIAGYVFFLLFILYSSTINVPSLASHRSIARPPVLTPTPVPVDSDGDGFADNLERYVTTNPNLKCGVNAWPVDFDNDRAVKIADMNTIVAKYGTTDRRYDLNKDGIVTIADINIVRSYSGKNCTDVIVEESSVSRIGHPVRPTLTPIPAPDADSAIDSDSDGFNNRLETYIGTNLNLKCGVNAWPVDFDNNKVVRSADISAVVAKYGTTDRRYDLNGDGRVTSADVSIVRSYYGKDCQ